MIIIMMKVDEGVVQDRSGHMRRGHLVDICAFFTPSPPKVKNVTYVKRKNDPGRLGTVLAGGLILSYHDNYHDEGRRKGWLVEWSGPRKESLR